MAKQKKTDGAVVVAEAIGRALGMVPGTAQALKAQHPHPVDDAMAALAEGQTRLAEATVAAGDPAGPIGLPAKKAATRTRTIARKTVARAGKSIGRTRKAAAKSSAGVRR